MSYEDDVDSVFVGREPCPTCGSEDNLARYSDGHAYCFGATCNHFEPPTDSSDGPEQDRSSGTRSPANERPTTLLDGTYTALSKRGLSEETCRLFDYQVGRMSGKVCQLAGYRFTDGTLAAQKARFPSKDEGLPWVGASRAERKKLALFGAHRFGRGKKIVITEGEIDAMTVSQVQGNKWPVVSVINGCDGAPKDIARNIEYLANFEEIILMFDMDEHGREAVEQVANVLVGMKVSVASLPLKDANECLVEGRAEDIIKAIWNAKPYSPASVAFGQDIIDRRRNRPKIVSLPFPDYMDELNTKVLGIRMGELDTWTSGSGMGKTTVLKQLQIHYFRETEYNQAIIALEEPLEDTAESLIGVFMEKRLTLPEVAEAVPEEDVRRAEEALFLATDSEGNPRLCFHDAFANVGSDEDLMNRIRYFAHAHNCKIFWLDHLSILVSGMGEDGDERRRIDALMHNLKELTVELGVYIGLISHLKKAQGSGPSFEEGAVPSLDDLRGSGGIKQLSNSVYALARNQQAETEEERNTVGIHVLKSRYTGDTGPAGFISFNKLTGTFVKGVDPELASPFEDMTQGAGESGTDDKEIPF